MFVIYLMGRFHEEDYTDDLLYQWARVREGGDGPLIRDMCGLARVLDNDSLYSDLGGSPPRPGNYRIRKVFHNYSIAKWLDDSTLSEYYSFGDDYSPTGNAGLFRKLSDSTAMCWENAVPPQFTVAEQADTMWMRVPGNASDQDDVDCDDGWNDPSNDEFCQNDYCDPVLLRLWGSNYLAFKADTTYYDEEKHNRYLQVKINWEEGAIHDSTELWVSVVRYPSARDTIPLFLLGDEVTHIVTGQFGPSADSVLINIPEFHKGGNEAAAVIMSLVATSHGYSELDCGAFPPFRKYCLPRYDDWPTDLEYSYAFTVLEEQSGGGCPFVSVGTSGGFEADNNVLAGAVFGRDGVDTYRLEQAPESVNGQHSVRLTEQDDDLSHFDRVSLLAVDHPPGTAVCVLPDGDIRTYRVGASPSSCYSESGVDLLNAVRAADGEVAVLPPGSWIEAEFPMPVRGGGGAGTKGGPGQKIPPPLGRRGGGGDGNTLDLTPFCYRANPTTGILPMPENVTPEGDVARLRFVAPTEFHIDELFLADLDVEEPVVRQCDLLAATHSTTGDCLAALVRDDGVRTQLSRGEVIDLSFAGLEADVPLVRDFVLVTEGYYGSDEEGRAFEQTTPSVLTISSPRPNPFTDASSIRFETQAPGGPVSVRVYALSGRLVRTLMNEVVTGGTREVAWDGRDDGGDRVASGVYFYQVDTPGLQARRKMVLVR